MFREEIDMAGNAAKKKIQFLRQQTGAYFCLLYTSDAADD